MRVTRSLVSVPLNKIHFKADLLVLIWHLFFPAAREILTLQAEIDDLNQLLSGTKTDSQLIGEWLYCLMISLRLTHVFSNVGLQNNKTINSSSISGLKTLLEGLKSRQQVLMKQLKEADYAQAQLSE